MNRLWLKLSLAFLAISLAAIALVALLSARTTREQFNQYVVASGMGSQSLWARTLIEHYAARGSWEGVDSVLAQLGPGSMGMGRWRGGAGAPTLAVADQRGVVIASTTGELVGQTLASDLLTQSVPLILDGQTIGALVLLHLSETLLDAQGQEFLRRVQTSLTWAALLAVALSLALATLVSRLLTAPLARLTQAAQAIAAGNLTQRVPVQSGDEIGALANAFNEMSASLAASEQLRKNLIADVAHELRTPLTVVQGNLQAILDGVYPLDMAQVSSLYDETRLLTRLVDDLHDLALADAGQLRLERQPVSMAALAQAALAQFGPLAQASEVHLELHADQSLPPVTGDPGRLAQVLRNLLSNALRYTPPGGLVTMRITAPPGLVQLQVTDSGPGIAAGDLPHVFDRFYRGDKSRSRAGGGAGLGLAIVRQLARAHGGEIEVSSAAGQGATFTLALPASPPAPTAPQD